MANLTDQFSKIAVVKKWHGSEQAKAAATHSEAENPGTDMVLMAVAKLGKPEDSPEVVLEVSSKAALDAVKMLMNDGWHENSFEVLKAQLTAWFEKMHKDFALVETLGLGSVNPMANVEFTLLEKQASNPAGSGKKTARSKNKLNLH